MVILFTADETLAMGLKMAGFDNARQQSVQRKTNIDRFKDFFGCFPVVYAQIWEDLQVTDLDEARIDTTRGSVNMDTFLLSLHFIKRYPTEKQRSGRSGSSERHVRDWGWYFLGKVAALKRAKIVWPEKWYTTFIISVDGVHCRFHEQKHPNLSKDPAMYSYKFNGPGLAYEIALCVFSGKVVHIKGPIKPKHSDREIYRSELQGMIPDGKLAIADGGYKDKRDPKISTPNVLDSKELYKFKSRARLRQETFNMRIKRFDCLDGPFRHSMHRHKVCFEAICVICQYEMDLVSSLYDV